MIHTHLRWDLKARLAIISGVFFWEAELPHGDFCYCCRGRDCNTQHAERIESLSQLGNIMRERCGAEKIIQGKSLGAEFCVVLKIILMLKLENGERCVEQ